MVCVTTILISIVFGVIAFTLLKRKKKEKLPPGPFAWPLVGNMLSLGSAPYKVFVKWAEQYGKMYTISFGGSWMVVLNDPVLIREAFCDPAFSGRPGDGGFTVLTDGPHGVVNSSGQEWVDQRRFTLRHLRDFGFGKHVMEELVMEEVNEFISTLKFNEGQPMSVIRKFNLIVLSSLWRIMSGERYSQNDPKLSKLLDGFNELRSENSTSFLIAFFLPSLAKLFPNKMGYNKLMKTIKEQQEFAKKSIKEHVNNKPEDGIPRDFMDAYLKEIDSTDNKNSSFYKDAGLKSLMAVVLDLFNAGSETTAMTLSWAFLYLTKFPDFQKKLQTELDSVVGKFRQVVLTDRPKLPYTEAVILEVLRYSTIIPFGVFHATTADVDFHGYHIPKGTWVTANHYHAHFNPELWDCPDKFIPERFLSEDGKKVKKSENLIPFSVGKRQCLGETLARDEVFLFLTNIFHRFSVCLAEESVNVPHVPKPGPFMEPHQFSLVFTDRM